MMMVALMGLATVASAQDLTGCWRNVRNPIRPCYIRQSGNQLQLTNEYGSTSWGQIYGPYDLVAYNWNNDHARIAAGGNVLVWDGNGEWDRDYSCAYGGF